MVEITAYCRRPGEDVYTALRSVSHTASFA
jgi:hypothetical protein